MATKVVPAKAPAKKMPTKPKAAPAKTAAKVPAKPKSVTIKKVTEVVTQDSRGVQTRVITTYPSATHKSKSVVKQEVKHG